MNLNYSRYNCSGCIDDVAYTAKPPFKSSSCSLNRCTCLCHLGIEDIGKYVKKLFWFIFYEVDVKRSKDGFSRTYTHPKNVIQRFLCRFIPLKRVIDG